MTAHRTPASGYVGRGLTERIVEELGRSIVVGELQAGEALPREEDLIDRYRVSRTTLRSALTVLAAKGLIEMRPKVGTRVLAASEWASFDPAVLRWSLDGAEGAALATAFLELRLIVEPDAARLAALRATPDDLDAMEGAVADMHARLDEDAYAHADVAFHVAVYRSTGNPVLAQFGDLVAGVMLRVFDDQQVRARSAHEDLAADARRHDAVVAAMRARDGAAAARAMRAVVLDGADAGDEHDD
ncbi:FadR/GntR family transcriptional regulator [Microbacterium allomyrinae]|uniref:FadR family transcriptional regulator n=1 Tax=Microbacterium allomyrinae TaxID=2830666 RepID=A0A9X1LTI6_9MICO|nr:FCD domain-containing protein [Microbacterium allomyrinae]MCC2031576.1 FadR family transcriptional regulator [Microbacterium allomyrinae]